LPEAAETEVNGAYNLGAMTFQRDLEEHAQEMARILTPGRAAKLLVSKPGGVEMR
jgi:hypothetical protein